MTHKNEMFVKLLKLEEGKSLIISGKILNSLKILVLAKTAKQKLSVLH
jgi:hypothetical protein